MDNLEQTPEPRAVPISILMLDGTEHQGVVQTFAPSQTRITFRPASQGRLAADPISVLTNKVAFIGFHDPNPAEERCARDWPTFLVELSLGHHISLKMPCLVKQAVGFYGHSEGSAAGPKRFFVFNQAVVSIHEVDGHTRQDPDCTHQVQDPPARAARRPNTPRLVARTADAPQPTPAPRAAPVSVAPAPAPEETDLDDSLFPELIDVDEPEETPRAAAAIALAGPAAAREVRAAAVSHDQKQTTPPRKGRASGGRLGERLVREGYIDEDQLSAALAAQASGKTRRMLGELLLEQHLITEDQLYRTIAKQYELPFVNLDHVPIDPTALNELEPAIMLKHKVLPFDVNATTLMVAISNPTDLDLHDLLRFRTNKKISEVVAAPTQLLGHLEQLLAKEAEAAQLDQILNEMEEETTDALLSVGTDEEQASETDSAVVKLVNRIITDAHRRGASDIHIEPQGLKAPTAVRLRIDGECSMYQQIPPGYWRAVVSRIKIMAHLDIAERRVPQDGKIQLKLGGRTVELRVATLPTVNGNEDVVMRLLASSGALPLDEMGLSARNLEELQKTIRQPYGLVLCVGPTGSGKTTTLHSALAVINDVDKKIWTAEDPVEITQPGLRQVQVQPKIDFTFAAAMRSFLRADPDVIMIGEMRDQETAHTAVEASMTGHLVLSTLHTNTAPETVTRLLDMGIDAFNFADALLAVLAQRLARRICSTCAEPYAASDEEQRLVLRAFEGEEQLASQVSGWKPGQLTLWRGKGCPACRDTGFRGRVALHELLIVDDAIRHSIQTRASVSQIRSQGQEGGMTTLMQDGIIKAINGDTSLKQVAAVCSR